MSKGDHIRFHGEVVKALGGGAYEVEVIHLDDQGNRVRTDSVQTLLGRLGGKLKKNRIRVLPGDEVDIDVSPYDMSHGFIVFRGRQRRSA